MMSNRAVLVDRFYIVFLINQRMLGISQRRSLSLPRQPRRTLERIRKQLEYYWSDANIARDKFFSERLARDADCWVTLSELRNFPLLRSMSASDTELLAAANSSPFLVVDHNRIDRDWKAFPPRGAIDNLANNQTESERGLYIENIPLHVDREEIQRILGGSVQHISIPRHQRTGERQGFAFAEFSTADQRRTVQRRMNGIWPDNWPLRKDGKRLRVMSFKRWNAMKDNMKILQSSSGQQNNYCAAIIEMLKNSTNDEYLINNDNSDEEDSVDDQLYGEEELADNEDDSFAETSLAERRRKNLATTRPNSVVRILNLPENVTISELRIWLGHFAVPIQHLDFDGINCFVRLADRRARDFFLTDFQISKLPIRGSLAEALALSPSEFLDYRVSITEKRTEKISQERSLGVKRQHNNRDLMVTSRLNIRRGWSKRALDTVCCAWTDTVAGNGRWAGPGTSEAYRHPLDRQENFDQQRSTN